MAKALKELTFKDDFSLSATFEDTAIKYFKSLIARTPSLIHNTRKVSAYLQFCPMQRQDDYVSVGDYEMAGELENFDDYKIAFLDNKSSEELVLPNMGFITLRERIICPISPLKAIIIEGDVGSSESDMNVVDIYDIKTSKEIRQINLAAFAQEKKRECKCIVSSSEDLLRSVNGEYR